MSILSEGLIIGKNSMAKFIGIDYGEKNIGIALSDDNGRLAFPHTVLQNDEKLLESLRKLCKENEVNSVVMGESRNLKGEANPILGDSLSFKTKIEQELNKKVHLIPEFLTTQQASRIQGQSEKTHASAAAIILQSFLDSHES
jgi:putative holliday junction resolvase